MRANTLDDLLKKGDRVAVSNITGREAGGVTATSQKYCGNIVGGWALGKGGQSLEIAGGEGIPVFANAEELFKNLPKEQRPNKIVVYSPPSAVYGEVKEVVEYGKDVVETLFIITEHVSVEVTAKIHNLCRDAGIDVLGCNTLGVINARDRVRVGAVGGDAPDESFVAGSVTVISNSGNMVNTMSSYLQSAGLGVSFGVSTGKDVLILTPLKELLELANKDEGTRLIVLYVEPGGLYEQEAIDMLRNSGHTKPIIAYVTGEILEKQDFSLGHAGAVVEGPGTTSRAKTALFDDYFGIEPYDPHTRYRKSDKLASSLARGIRIETLHHLPAAAAFVCDIVGIERDFVPRKPLALNPWFLNFGKLGKSLPSRLLLRQGTIPEPAATQVRQLEGETVGAKPSRRDMRNASYASSSDGAVTRMFGRSLEEEMEKGSFARSLILYWTGEEPEHDFEVELLEKCLIASLSNGPGTISAQGAKSSASAGNMPNTAMIATLASLGSVHGGNGQRAVRYLLRVFKGVNLEDPYSKQQGFDLQKVVDDEVEHFSKVRRASKEAGTDYERIPCLGHPVFRDKPVNFDPRERIISRYLEGKGLYNAFLDFYHRLAHKMKEAGIARNVWAVNLDGAIASVSLGICWKALKEKRMTIQRASDIAFLVFALGRAAGGAGEFLDHQDHGLPMDMRIPVDDCISLTRPKD